MASKALTALIDPQDKASTFSTARGATKRPSESSAASLSGVCHDRVDDRVPGGPVQLVAAPVEADQLRADDRLRQRNPVRDRVDRIGRAVNDQQRCVHLVQPASPRISAPPREVR